MSSGFSESFYFALFSSPSRPRSQRGSVSTSMPFHSSRYALFPLFLCSFFRSGNFFCFWRFYVDFSCFQGWLQIKILRISSFYRYHFETLEKKNLFFFFFWGKKGREKQNARSAAAAGESESDAEEVGKKSGSETESPTRIRTAAPKAQRRLLRPRRYGFIQRRGWTRIRNPEVQKFLGFREYKN